MDPILGGALIGAGSKLFSDLLGFGSSGLTYKQSKNLQAQQNAWNLKQWHRQNEYNSPTSQMSRYMAAGINPNLVAGQIAGGNASGNLLSAAAEPMRKNDFPGIRELGNYIMQSQQMKLQKELQESQISLQREQSRVARAQARRENAVAKETEDRNKITQFDINKAARDEEYNKQYQISDREIERSFRVASYEQQIKLLEQNVSKASAEVKKIYNDIYYRGLEYDLLKKMNSAQVYSLLENVSIASQRLQNESNLNEWQVNRAAIGFLNDVTDGKIRLADLGIKLSEENLKNNQLKTYWFDKIFEYLRSLTGAGLDSSKSASTILKMVK